MSRRLAVKEGCLGTNQASETRSLQSTAYDLERQRMTDSLKKGLQHRPERDELVERMRPSVPL